MSEQRDPVLERLFGEACEELADDDFSSAVMASVDARRRRVLLGRLTIPVLLVMIELLLDSPLQHSVSAVSDVLGSALIDIRSEWLAFVLTPVNSVAGLLGLALLGLQFGYRKLFH